MKRPGLLVAGPDPKAQARRSKPGCMFIVAWRAGQNKKERANMETADKSVIRFNDLYDTMGDVGRNLEKILAIIDQLNNNYFEKLSKPSFKALASWKSRPGETRATEEETLSYDWIIDYERIQNFFEIIEDYVRTSKGILDAKQQEEIRNRQANGSA